MNATRNPLLLLVINFIVGALVTRGIIEPNDHNYVAEQLSDLVGLAIILLTTIVSLFKVIKHKHPDDMMQPSVPALTTEQHTTLISALDSLGNKNVTIEKTTTTTPTPGNGTPADATDPGTPASVPETGHTPTP